MKILRCVSSTLTAYVGGSLGFILGESLAYADGKVTDGSGTVITVSRMLPELVSTPFTNTGFIVFLAVCSAVMAAIASWIRRWSWFDGAGLPGIAVLSIGSGFTVGTVFCLALFLCFGGWDPPFPLLFVGGAIGAVFCAAILTRHPLLTSEQLPTAAHS